MPLIFKRLGRVPFAEADALQRKLAAEREQELIPDHILFLEHPPVYTQGKQSSEEDLQRPAAWLRAQGIQIAKTDRGGRLTYHGPGQLVGYLILKWRGPIPRLVHGIEAALIATLAHWGIEGRRDPAYPGVWVESAGSLAKIAAIGLHVSHSVTRHGFALNVSPNLSHYEGIIPCGIEDRPVTSMAALSGQAPALEAVMELLEAGLCHIFTRNLDCPRQNG